MPKPIRVLQLASPSGLYGAEHWILALIRHLDPQHIQSAVVAIKDTPDSTAPVCAIAHEMGAASFVLDVPGRFNLSAISHLKRLILTARIDIVHSHGYKTDFIGLLAARAAGCKIVATPHGWTNNPDFKLRLYELFDKMVFMFCDAVVPLSPGLFRSIQQTPFVRKKLTLITNGVDLTEVGAVKKIPTEITRLKQNGKLIIGSIGRLVPGKGLDIIMRALAHHCADNCHFIVIGTGPQEAELKKLAGELGIAAQIDFLGFRQDRLAFLKGFDVFAMASLSEGTPRCVMEAMAARVPVVASDIEGCRNLIRHGETGLLFEVGNPKALAEGIRLLLSNQSLREKVKTAAASYVAEKFSAARMAQEYEILFTRLAGSKSLLSP